jgi:hypothetical protein
MNDAAKGSGNVPLLVFWVSSVEISFELTEASQMLKLSSEVGWLMRKPLAGY